MGSENLTIELTPRVAADTCPPAPQASLRSADPGISKYFDETTLYWDQIYTGHKFINWHLAERRELVIDAVRRISHGRALKVLDLGSGSGVLTRDLLRMGHSVVALDCSEEMMRTLMRRSGGRPDRRFLGAVLGSAGDVCFRNESFDVIICVGVIQYQRHPESIFEEMNRLLRPGGACVFTVPNQLSLHHLLDPWCSLRYVYRLMLRSLRHSRSLRESCRAALDHSTAHDDVYERRYFRREFPALVRTRPWDIRETLPFGYGPLTLLNKQVLQDRPSIALSKAITKLSQSRPLSWISILANRWVVVLEKSRC